MLLHFDELKTLYNNLDQAQNILLFKNKKILVAGKLCL